MPSTLNQQLAKLRQLNLSVRQGLEAAELYIPQINQQLSQLLAIGLLPRQMCLGDIIDESRYDSPHGPRDSTWLHQAAIGVGFGGVGAVGWDSNDLWTFIHFEGPIDAQVVLNFVPFADCPSAIKGLLLPQVEPLVRHACKLIRA